LIKLEKGEVTGLQSAIRELNQIDRGIVKQLRKDLKSELTGEAKELAASVPASPPPMSGFNHKGRTRWNGAKGSVSVAPSRIRKGKNTHPIVTIRLTGKGNSVGFDVAEMAGLRNLRWSVSQTKSSTRNGQPWERSHSRKQGKKFVQSLQASATFKFKGGRFAYGFFLRQRKGINKKAVKVMDRFAKKFNKKVSR